MAGALLHDLRIARLAAPAAMTASAIRLVGRSTCSSERMPLIGLGYPTGRFGALPGQECYTQHFTGQAMMLGSLFLRDSVVVVCYTSCVARNIPMLSCCTLAYGQVVAPRPLTECL